MHLVREEDVQLTKESLLLALVPSLCLVEKLFSYNLHHGELQLLLERIVLARGIELVE